MLSLGESGSNCEDSNPIHSLYSLDKPQGTRTQRQISRMIKHLCEQYCQHYQKHKPQQHQPLPHSIRAMPSSWLIEQLVINAAKSSITRCENWQQRVKLTLKQIILDTSYYECLYINYTNNLPLFPNNELYEPWEVKLAMIALVEFLDGEH